MNEPSESLPPTSTSRDAANQRPQFSGESPDDGPIPAPLSSAADSAVDRFRQGVASKHTGASDPETEQSLWQGGYSAKAMGGVWLSAALATVVLIVASQLYATGLGIALAIAAAIWAIAGLVYAVRRLGIHYELTTQRFVHQHGVFSRRTDRIEVIDIDDVSFFQGPIQRIMGIGTIDITSSDRSHPQLLMPGIAEVKTVAGLIDDVRRRERTRRSLHIRSM